MSNFSKVGTFMKTFGQEVKTEPSFSTDKINKLRIDLIKEELEELTDAMKKKDLLEVADALNSNMSKLDENGKPIYNDSGKVMKGPNYFKPDLPKFVT